MTRLLLSIIGIPFLRPQEQLLPLLQEPPQLAFRLPHRPHLPQQLQPGQQARPLPLPAASYANAAPSLQVLPVPAHGGCPCAAGIVRALLGVGRREQLQPMRAEAKRGTAFQREDLVMEQSRS